MESFPREFNASILGHSYAPDKRDKMCLQRKRIYDGVYDALSNKEREFHVDIVRGLSAIQIRDLVIDLYTRFPQRIFYENWTPILDTTNPPIRDKYIIVLV